MDLPPTVQDLEVLGTQIYVTKYIFIALYSAFIYDHLLTLNDEIEFIWKRRFSIVTFLFVMNRYYALLVMSVICASFFSPLFAGEVCRRFVAFFPFGVGMPLIVMSGILMGLRAHVLYNRSKVVAVFLVCYLIVEFIVAARFEGAPGYHPLIVPPEVDGLEAFHICIDETADNLGNGKPATFQFMETIYDTIIFGMIIAKTITAVRLYRSRNIIFLIAKHGILYFAVIFTSNIIWALLILLAPTGLKYSTSMPTVMLVCTMVNRMTIHLRAYTVSRGYRITLAKSGTHWDASQNWPRFADATEDETYPNTIGCRSRFGDEEYGLGEGDRPVDSETNLAMSRGPVDPELGSFDRELFDDVGFGAYG